MKISKIYVLEMSDDEMSVLILALNELVKKDCLTLRVDHDIALSMLGDIGKIPKE